MAKARQLIGPGERDHNMAQYPVVHDPGSSTHRAQRDNKQSEMGGARFPCADESRYFVDSRCPIESIASDWVLER